MISISVEQEFPNTKKNEFRIVTVCYWPFSQRSQRFIRDSWQHIHVFTHTSHPRVFKRPIFVFSIVIYFSQVYLYLFLFHEAFELRKRLGTYSVRRRLPLPATILPIFYRCTYSHTFAFVFMNNVYKMFTAFWSSVCVASQRLCVASNIAIQPSSLIIFDKRVCAISEERARIHEWELNP